MFYIEARGTGLAQIGSFAFKGQAAGRFILRIGDGKTSNSETAFTPGSQFVAVRL
jgi:hypothetical protein